eukprot:TRINITY_DN77265_c0_g1_i1.p1 TRINITY_DN77265_c0_g1~~TRINITY_DN77265_c0_g1_i1.p1  ORF type:complete len:284 (-),score=48.01 TRINITY_DN77265_c0_g1_i1:12-824(-)
MNAFDEVREVAPPQRRSTGLSFTVSEERGRSSFRNPGAEALSESFTKLVAGRADLIDGQADEGLCNGNVIVLAVTGFLFLLITVTQAIAAEIAESQALMADCKSMGVDSATYFMNMLVEFARGNRFHRPLQLIVPLISISVLVILTWQSADEALESLNEPTEGEEVNMYIVFAFASFGIIFDVISVHLFMRNSREDGKSVNMCSALMHVLADLLRSTTTLIASIMMFCGYSSEKVDAWASLIVSGLIFAGAAFALYEWVMSLVKDGCRSG